MHDTAPDHGTRVQCLNRVRERLGGCSHNLIRIELLSCSYGPEQECISKGLKMGGVHVCKDQK